VLHQSAFVDVMLRNPLQIRIPNPLCDPHYARSKTNYSSKTQFQHRVKFD